MTDVSRREFLKSGNWAAWRREPTDQQRGVSCPPMQKEVPSESKLLPLVPPEQFTVGGMPTIDALRQRRSWRRYSPTPLSVEELSFLVWATQGIESLRGNGTISLRPVPSAGARHPFEGYLLVNRVTDIDPGLYRYLPLSHQLCLEAQGPDLVEAAQAASNDQYVRGSAVTFIWTALPYRSEWRYADHAHRVIAIDVGHLCQNLYLAATAIGVGVCAIAAYNQAAFDALLGVDGQDEFTIYLATVGKLPDRRSA